MTAHLTFSGSRTARGPIRRALVASVLTVCGVAVMSGCGKTITIGDAPAPASSAPAAPAAPAVDNTGLQLVNSTAAEAGLNGTGGTVVGAAVQETPPQWVQLTAVTAPPLSSPRLVNINQAALYRFDKDTANPSQSNCDDSCAAQWPPVTVKQGGHVYLSGVDPQQIGAIQRKDGQIQLTVGGWPVYRFAGDAQPGDLKGQGIGGTWFAVSPDGGKVLQ
ncbi:hypothetical protein Pth03_51240 [Planotetraspora thailandica]|uniref:Lipoprotein n=1 Tax=Planotetraspora thailandica TaxID=487172 RepID=A0A8J3XY05_9ACTN|nr:hypothetical protein [Planotetraspora thailandica]GII56735.1 hypothetical protein Pth03_51240 [Planotetraspora thailandica]